MHGKEQLYSYSTDICGQSLHQQPSYKSIFISQLQHLHHSKLQPFCHKLAVSLLQAS